MSVNNRYKNVAPSLQPTTLVKYPPPLTKTRAAWPSREPDSGSTPGPTLDALGQSTRAPLILRFLRIYKMRMAKPVT